MSVWTALRWAGELPGFPTLLRSSCDCLQTVTQSSRNGPSSCSASFWVFIPGYCKYQHVVMQHGWEWSGLFSRVRARGWDDYFSGFSHHHHWITRRRECHQRRVMLSNLYLRRWAWGSCRHRRGTAAAGCSCRAIDWRRSNISKRTLKEHTAFYFIQFHLYPIAHIYCNVHLRPLSLDFSVRKPFKKKSSVLLSVSLSVHVRALMNKGWRIVKTPHHWKLLFYRYKRKTLLYFINMLDPVNKTTPKSLRLTENTECVRTDVIVLMSHVTLQHFFFSSPFDPPSR